MLKRQPTFSPELIYRFIGPRFFVSIGMEVNAGPTWDFFFLESRRILSWRHVCLWPPLVLVNPGKFGPAGIAVEYAAVSHDVIS